MKPLEHIRVVELAQYVAGPVTARFLADWGAKVIKIESPKGDANRKSGLINLMPIEDDENPAFDNTNFNKEFICVDTKTPEGLAVVHKLLETADVFVTNYRTKVLKAMGLDYDDLKERYPRLVWAHVLGFGDVGPAKDAPGFDYTAYAARGGLLGTTYQKGGVPINGISSFGDHQTGMGLAGGICAALVARERTGKGDKVTISLHGTALYTLGWGIMGVEYGSTYPKSYKSVNVPSMNIYQSSDGYWIQMCGANYDIFYPRIMRALGHPELVDDPEWSSLANVQAKGMTEDVIGFFAEEMGKYTADEIKARFLEADAVCEKAYLFEDVLEDEQAWATGALVSIEYPNGTKHTNVATPVRLASHEPEYRITRRKGADTKEILLETGYSEEEIAAMVEAGTILI